MGQRELVVIHAEPDIAWHAARLPQFAEGLRVMGFDVQVTASRQRITAGRAVLFGTSLWRGIERAPGKWLLVDRASVGDPDYVTLGWNGHGRDADYRLPADITADRWGALGVDLAPQQHGEAVVICGEWDGAYPPVSGATHFRPHPAGGNPTSLPTLTEWLPGTYHGLRSSVLVEALIRGYQVVANDRTSMAYRVTDRRSWAHWLAWTQWSWHEIETGQVEHLFR